MGGKRKKPGRIPVIDSAAKVAMLGALREGRRLGEVAACYGVTLQAFYSARRRDPLFAAAWRDAHALSAEAERRPVEAADGDEIRIAPNNRRPLQRRRMRHVRFDERRKGAFLVHFAHSGDVIAAAAAAGVCERTVHNHRRSDPAFAASFQAALEESLVELETEAVRERLEAQRRLRAAVEAAEREGTELPAGEQDVQFERTMRLLRYWRRRGGGSGGRRAGRGRLQSMDFFDAMALVGKRLRSLGIPIVALPPEGDEAG